MELAVSVKNLVVEYDQFRLENVNIEVPAGTIVGFVGENGAGKTTTIKAILNLIHYQKGEIKVFGKEMSEGEQEIKKRIGVDLDDSFFYDNFKVKEICQVLRQMFPDWDQNFMDVHLKKAGIDPQKKFKECSMGMKAKLKILTAVAHQPELLILDEPTSGLDPVSRDDILELFLEFVQDEQHTILFSSHITTDIEKIADYIIFIHEGQIELNIEKDQLLDTYGLLKCSKQDAADLADFPYEYHQSIPYAEKFVIKDRQGFQKEFPDLTVERITIDELLLMMSKGERA